MKDELTEILSLQKADSPHREAGEADANVKSLGSCLRSPRQSQLKTASPKPSWLTHSILSGSYPPSSRSGSLVRGEIQSASNRSAPSAASADPPLGESFSVHSCEAAVKSYSVSSREVSSRGDAASRGEPTLAFQAGDSAVAVFKEVPSTPPSISGSETALRAQDDPYTLEKAYLYARSASMEDIEHLKILHGDNLVCQGQLAEKWIKEGIDIGSRWSSEERQQLVELLQVETGEDEEKYCVWCLRVKEFAEHLPLVPVVNTVRIQELFGDSFLVETGFLSRYGMRCLGALILFFAVACIHVADLDIGGIREQCALLSSQQVLLCSISMMLFALCFIILFWPESCHVYWSAIFSAFAVISLFFADLDYSNSASRPVSVHQIVLCMIAIILTVLALRFLIRYRAPVCLELARCNHGIWTLSLHRRWRPPLRRPVRDLEAFVETFGYGTRLIALRAWSPSDWLRACLFGSRVGYTTSKAGTLHLFFSQSKSGPALAMTASLQEPLLFFMKLRDVMISTQHPLAGVTADYVGHWDGDFDNASRMESSSRVCSRSDSRIEITSRLGSRIHSNQDVSDLETPAP
jgi:hypothetical protein